MTTDDFCALMRRCRLTQAQMADALGMSVAQVSRYARGISMIPITVAARAREIEREHDTAAITQIMSL